MSIAAGHYDSQLGHFTLMPKITLRNDKYHNIWNERGSTTTQDLQACSQYILQNVQTFLCNSQTSQTKFTVIKEIPTKPNRADQWPRTWRLTTTLSAGRASEETMLCRACSISVRTSHPCRSFLLPAETTQLGLMTIPQHFQTDTMLEVNLINQWQWRRSSWGTGPSEFLIVTATQTTEALPAQT